MLTILSPTKRVYAVGTSTCNSGVHVVNVRDPTSPTFCDGYVHDAQCVNYKEPDIRYSGKEICFCYNEDTLTVVDVTDKTNMKLVSRVGYKNSQYTHQG